MKNYKIYTTLNIITYKDGEISSEIKSINSFVVNR